MAVIVSMLLCIAAFTALALSLPRHHREVFGCAPSSGRERRFRLPGWTLIVLSLVPAIAHSEAGIGLVSWFGAATAGGLCTMALLTYRPRLIVRAALASVPLSLGVACMFWKA
ncbi:MAG: DUF3325 domain-containing protein [Novosphingobium sp.]